MKIFGYFWDLEKLHVEIPEMIYLWIYIYRYGSHIWNRVYFYQICLFFSVFKSPKFSWKKSHAFHGNNCAARQWWRLCRPSPARKSGAGSEVSGRPWHLSRPGRGGGRCHGAGFGGNKVGRPWPRTQGVSLRLSLGWNPVGGSLAVIR